jgi:hypothetical protein
MLRLGCWAHVLADTKTAQLPFLLEIQLTVLSDYLFFGGDG